MLKKAASSLARAVIGLADQQLKQMDFMLLFGPNPLLAPATQYKRMRYMAGVNTGTGTIGQSTNKISSLWIGMAFFDAKFEIIFVTQSNKMAKAKEELQALVAEQKILNRIYVIRGQKVMIDEDLAEMYKVETKRLNEQVKRNIKRFPKDFMFALTQKEFDNLKSQNATSSWGGRRKLPNAFTEQGVAMLSSILNSDTAIEVNIRIIRVFTRLREYALTHKEILLQLAKLEKEVKGNSIDIENIFAVLKELIEKDAKPTPRNKIGFRQYD